MPSVETWSADAESHALMVDEDKQKSHGREDEQWTKFVSPLISTSPTLTPSNTKTFLSPSLTLTYETTDPSKFCNTYQSL